MIIQNNKEGFFQWYGGSLVCLDYFNFKSLSWKVYGLNPDNWTFDFMKIFARIMNKISKVQQNKNNLIYAEMVKVLR